MTYIGEIGKRIKVEVTYKKSFSYVDHKFGYYGTTHYIHTFEDAEGNVLVWKTTNPVEYIKNDCFEFATEGSVVELTGTVKEHSEYKDQPQTVATRCKFNLVERAKTEHEIQKEEAEAQMTTIGENDTVWTMNYKRYKEHYSDCETIAGSFEVIDGIAHIKVIIREGRMKNSGTRGRHFHVFRFETNDGGIVSYRAVCEENARKQMKKEFADCENFKCVEIM